MMRLYLSQHRTVRDLYAMAWINGDGYQHNVFVRFPDGTIGRPKTWFWQDIYSRRIVGYRTDRTEHSDMIRSALGDVIERYGIPEHATIDNTARGGQQVADRRRATRYRFKVREEDPVGLMPQLGIKLHWTSVHNGKGHGQAKAGRARLRCGRHRRIRGQAPEVRRRLHRPQRHGQARELPVHGGRVDVFVQVLRAEIDAWNARTGRRTEICAGELSFDQAFRDSYERSAHLIRRATEAQRRMWMLAAEAVTVQRDASVALAIGKGRAGATATPATR